ncbi:MAG: hypothetical protein H6969_03615 [Gammaproteobacteria bacterium]|nr:hypothetical protein [Gammaproteobacteria bacterium]
MTRSWVLSLLRAGEKRRSLRNAAGVIVGRLSQNCVLPTGDVVDVTTISAVITRTRRQAQGTAWEALCKTERWEVVLCQVAVQPAGD